MPHSVEKRLETLEAQVAQLLQVQSSAGKDWRRAIQKYAGDEDLRQIFQAALHLRQADRKKSRRTTPPRKTR